MEIALTWNLVLLAIFVLLFAYSFLLGQNSTIKLILSTYIAILTADGISRVIQEYIFMPSEALQNLLGENQIMFFMSFRIIIFLIAVVIFVVKGSFHISTEKHEHWAARTVLHGGFAFLSAMLFLSTCLIYLSGKSFVEGMLFASQINIYAESLLARIMIDFYHLWFTLPAIAFLIASFVFPSQTMPRNLE